MTHNSSLACPQCQLSMSLGVRQPQSNHCLCWHRIHQCWGYFEWYPWCSEEITMTYKVSFCLHHPCSLGLVVVWNLQIHRAACKLPICPRPQGKPLSFKIWHFILSNVFKPMISATSTSNRSPHVKRPRFTFSQMQFEHTTGLSWGGSKRMRVPARLDSEDTSLAQFLFTFKRAKRRDKHLKRPMFRVPLLLESELVHSSTDLILVPRICRKGCAMRRSQLPHCRISHGNLS